MTEPTKTCSRCKTPKPLDDFKTDSRKPDGKASSCKACNSVPKVAELRAKAITLTPVAASEKPYKDHPFAGLFPLLSEFDLGELASDIASNGQRDPIILHRDLVLDGRNRYRACILKGIVPRFEMFTGTNDEALDFVISKNVYRRHLSSSQRAIAMADYEEYRHGGKRRNLVFQDANLHLEGIDDPAKPAATRAELAERGHVSERLIASAAVVRDHGADELKEAVRSGELAVSAAEDIAQRPADEQRAILATLPRDAAGKLTPEAKKALGPVIKEIRAEKQIEKKQKRKTREKVLGGIILALPQTKAGVIVSDFEWHFKVRSAETGMDRHAANHYLTAADCNTPEEIVERQRERMSVAADDCVHFMWCPASFNAIALKVMELQGFKYVSQFVWIKPGIGTGYWVRDKHELLLIGVRGNIPCPAMGDQFDSAIPADKGPHSKKPDFQYEIAEAYFPTLPKIELNARRARSGWIQWGNEAPSDESEAA
jgi:N6-adenosine-specific RNA methylase IME4